MFARCGRCVGVGVVNRDDKIAPYSSYYSVDITHIASGLAANICLYGGNLIYQLNDYIRVFIYSFHTNYG